MNTPTVPEAYKRQLQAHFALTGVPFRKNMVASEMFDSRGQRDLLHALLLWIGVRGLCLVTGPSGVGKSITLRRFIQELDQSRYRVVYLPNSVRDFTDFPCYGQRRRLLLNETATSLSAEAMAAVRQHIQTHLDSDGERWLRQGTRYASQSDDCPYCGQAIADSTFAALFPAFFDDAYQRLQEKIAKAVLRVSVWQEWLTALVRAKRANQGTVASLSKFITIEEQPDADPIESHASELVTQLRAVMVDKQAHLLDALGADSRVQAVGNDYTALATAVREYQQWVRSSTGMRNALLNNHAGAIASVQAEVTSLRARLLAGSATMMVELAGLDRASAAVAQTKAILDAAQRDLAAREALRTTAFVDLINAVLTDFGAGFRLSGLRGKPSSTRVIADFEVVLVDGGRVVAQTSVSASSRSGGPRFDTVLSEGDRTTLALAVFFAKCTSTPDPKRIAVLDDPLTSLDTGRRAMTMKYVQALADSCAQVWMFSHDEFFLRDGLPQVSTWLTITEEAEGSAFTVWDPEMACKTLYARNLDRLCDFVARAPGAMHAEDAWQKVRPILEGYLRFRFPKAWGDKEWLGDFIKKARAGHASIPLSPADIEQVAIWSRFSSPGMHEQPFDAGVPPAEAEVRAIASAVVAFVQA